MIRFKLRNSSLHNVSKKRLEQIATGKQKAHAPKPLAKVNKESARLWAQARRDCFKKYGRKCFLCGSEQNLCVHHIILRSLEPKLKYEQDNLCCLCASCHNHSGYDKKYIELTKKLVALGLGAKYNLLVSHQRIEYEVEKV